MNLPKKSSLLSVFLLLLITVGITKHSSNAPKDSNQKVVNNSIAALDKNLGTPIPEISHDHNLLALVETNEAPTVETITYAFNKLQYALQKLHTVLNNTVNKQQYVDIDQTISSNFVALKPIQEESATSIPKKKSINITSYLRNLQIVVDNIEIAENTDTVKTKAVTLKDHKPHKDSALDQIEYWQTVHSIESKQGKLMYRPRNKDRNCNYTSGPCGHHQLTVQALKDIGCKSLQCRKDRLDYNKSLQLSKKLLALNEKRLKKNGISKLEDYQKYLIHQQGANGIKNILAATQGKKQLSKTIKKNMANNSPYSYKQFRKMGSKSAANKFMQHWKHKWVKEKRLILASNTKSTNRQVNLIAIPTFSDNDLNFALNLRF